MGNRDRQKKERTLTAAEQARLEHFEEVSKDMQAQGYARTDLTISISSANVFSIILAVPIAAAGLILFFLVNRAGTVSFGTRHGFTLLFVVFIILVVVHELIHGISWSFFSEHHFKDIEFGFMKESLTPYCTCKAPLSRKPYIFGALMPLVVLGIIPMIIGIVSGSLFMLILGILMTVSAGGDIMLVLSILRHKSSAREAVYMDHPTEAGSVVFEK